MIKRNKEAGGIKMNEIEFLSNIAEILEVDVEEINMETDFRKDISYWDSLKGYSLIVMLDDEYETSMEVEEFLKAQTVKDLYQYVIKDK